MTDAVTMIMPMAGRGSRFAALGQIKPKPLIEIAGFPFFYWATLGVLREIPYAELVFVVLREHIEAFAIDELVHAHFPHARLAVVPEVTAGALETTLKGLDHVAPRSQVIVNDCDHAFSYSTLPQACASLSAGCGGFLTHFRSDAPHFSYATYDASGNLKRTAEKKVISDRAIAGVYGFRNAETLAANAKTYVCDCPYAELFISGVYDTMIRNGERVSGFDLDFHIPFGVPEEFHQAQTRTSELEGLKP